MHDCHSYRLAVTWSAKGAITQEALNPTCNGRDGLLNCLILCNELSTLSYSCSGNTIGTWEELRGQRPRGQRMLQAANTDVHCV